MLPLTHAFAVAKGAAMTRTPLLLPLIAAAALAGCNNSGHTIVAGGPDEGNDTNTVAPKNVELPPTIASSKSYRCGDNSIVSVDWLSDKKSANLRIGQTAEPNHVTAAAEGQPMSGNGYTVEGAFAGSTVKVTEPGKPTQTCNA